MIMTSCLVILCILAAAFVYLFCTRAANKRLSNLRLSGLTIEVSQIIDEKNVIVVRVGFGHGKEFWVVPSDDWEIDAEHRIVTNGKLLLVNGDFSTLKDIGRYNLQIEDCIIRM